MDEWMDDGKRRGREEDDGGRRERVEARLDDASRLFGPVYYCHMTNNRSVPSTAHQVSTGLNSYQISSCIYLINFWDG